MRYWLIRAYPLNEVGIFILCHFLHAHVAIFCNEKWWNTRRDGDLSKVNAILVYRGSSVYDDSRLMSTAQYSEVKEEVRRYKLKIEHHNKKIAEQEKREAKEKEQQKQQDSTVVKAPAFKAAARVSPPPLEKQVSDSETDIDLEHVMSADEQLLHNMDENDNIMQKDVSPTDGDEDENDNIMQNNVTPTDSGNQDAQGNIMQKNIASANIMQNNGESDSEDNLTLASIIEKEKENQKEVVTYEDFKKELQKKKKKKKTKKHQKENKEKIVDVQQPTRRSARLAAAVTKSKPIKYSDIVEDKLAKAKHVKMRLIDHRLKRKKKRERKFKCLICKKKCDTMCTKLWSILGRNIQTSSTSVKNVLKYLPLGMDGTSMKSYTLD